MNAEQIAAERWSSNKESNESLIRRVAYLERALDAEREDKELLWDALGKVAGQLTKLMEETKFLRDDLAAAQIYAARS